MRGCSNSRSQQRKIDSSKNEVRTSNNCSGKGRVVVVGIGPGDREHLTDRVIRELQDCDVVIGYHAYVTRIAKLVEGKEIHVFPMRTELKRAQLAVKLACAGKQVVLVSGGDPGLYGMASPLLEVASGHSDIDVEIAPGVSALSLVAAMLGAPLAHDFAVISLSDLLTPWNEIEKRLEAAAKADFVTVLFNPKSTKRGWQIKRAQEIFIKHRRQDTPVAVVRNSTFSLTTLAKFCDEEIDMRTTVVIGNSQTYVYTRWMITPRGYRGDLGNWRN